MTFPLSTTLSMQLVKVRQKRDYNYTKTNKHVKYSRIKYKLDNMPRPNHGMDFEQLIDFSNRLSAIVITEARQMKSEGYSLTNKQALTITQVLQRMERTQNITFNKKQ